MRRILALWAAPRSTSTAFEWIMRMRGYITCFHEPFGEPWYQGEAPLWPRVKADRVKEIYEIVLPHYLHLHAYRFFAA